MSPSTFELTGDEYECDPRGPIPVKGRGEMVTYLLLSKRDPAPARSG